MIIVIVLEDKNVNDPMTNVSIFSFYIHFIDTDFILIDFPLFMS